MTILSGTGQNIVGLGVFVVASFAMNILLARAFGKGSAAFGQVTLATQLAFVAGAATRFGMDMAAVRRVAIEVGKGEGARSQAIVRIAVRIALAMSIGMAVLGLLVRRTDRTVREGSVERLSRGRQSRWCSLRSLRCIWAVRAD